MGLEEFLIQMHNILVVIAILLNIIAFIIGIGLIKQIIEIILMYVIMSIVRQYCSCGSVVEHCVSSAKGCGFNSQGTHILKKCRT